MRRVDLVTADGVVLVGHLPDAANEATVVTAVDPRDQRRDGASPLHRFFVFNGWDGRYHQKKVYELVAGPEIPT